METGGVSLLTNIKTLLGGNYWEQINKKFSMIAFIDIFELRRGKTNHLEMQEH